MARTIYTPVSQFDAITISRGRKPTQPTGHFLLLESSQENGRLRIVGATPHITQYKKAPTFARGCGCSDRQPSERERLGVTKTISAWTSIRPRSLLP